MNTKQFKSKLTTLVTAGKRLTESVQTLADYAVEQAGHANLTAMADLLLKTKGIKAINSHALETYLFASVTGVQWFQPMADKKASGSRTIRQKKDQTIGTVDLKVSWIEFVKEKGETKVTSLPKITADNRKVRLATYRAKVKATTDRVALDNQKALLTAELAALEIQIKKVSKVTK